VERHDRGHRRRVVTEVRHRRVVVVVVHEQHLARKRHRLEHAVEELDDVVALVVDGDDDGDPGPAACRLAHTVTPRPRTFQMSTIGRSVSNEA
jgi:hypothetical protein